jgi:predicted ribosomally synthesized peptide with SipW-like signal peptide
MSQHRAEPIRRGGRRRARRGYGRLPLLAGLTLLGCVATTGTWAYWTDQTVVTGTSMTAGTIDLKVDGQDTVTAYAPLTLGAMVPGSSSATVLTLKNGGTADLRATATSSATNPDAKNLAAALQVKVTADTVVTGTGSARTCAGSALAGAGTTLGGALVPARTITPGAESKVCVQVGLPANAASSLQGGTTAVTLTFTGTSDLS